MTDRYDGSGGTSRAKCSLLNAQSDVQMRTMRPLRAEALEAPPSPAYLRRHPQTSPVARQRRKPFLAGRSARQASQAAGAARE